MVKSPNMNWAWVADIETCAEIRGRDGLGSLSYGSQSSAQQGPLGVQRGLQCIDGEFIDSQDATCKLLRRHLFQLGGIVLFPGVTRGW